MSKWSEFNIFCYLFWDCYPHSIPRNFSFFSGFIANPVGVIASVLSAPLAAALLVQDRQKKEAKIALQIGSALLASSLVAPAASLAGISSSPLWNYMFNSSEQAQAEILPTEIVRQTMTIE